MSLKTLLDKMPRPPHPIEAVTESDWGIYHLITGISLPEDYKQYLSTYGTGIIGGILTPFNPFCKRTSWKPSYSCRNWMRQALGTKDAKHKFGEHIFPYALYPEPEGVLPWGGSDNGDMLYWVTKGNPNEWTVLVHEVRSSNFQAFNFTMTGFLYAWLTGEIQCEILPYDEIDQALLFEPL